MGIVEYIDAENLMEIGRVGSERLDTIEVNFGEYEIGEVGIGD